MPDYRKELSALLDLERLARRNSGLSEAVPTTVGPETVYQDAAPLPWELPVSMPGSPAALPSGSPVPPFGGMAAAPLGEAPVYGVEPPSPPSPPGYVHDVSFATYPQYGPASAEQMATEVLRRELPEAFEEPRYSEMPPAPVLPGPSSVMEGALELYQDFGATPAQAVRISQMEFADQVVGKLPTIVDSPELERLKSQRTYVRDLGVQAAQKERVKELLGQTAWDLQDLQPTTGLFPSWFSGKPQPAADEPGPQMTRGQLFPAIAYYLGRQGGKAPLADQPVAIQQLAGLTAEGKGLDLSLFDKLSGQQGLSPRNTQMLLMLVAATKGEFTGFEQIQISPFTEEDLGKVSLTPRKVLVGGRENARALQLVATGKVLAHPAIQEHFQARNETVSGVAPGDPAAPQEMDDSIATAYTAASTDLRRLLEQHPDLAKLLNLELRKDPVTGQSFIKPTYYAQNPKYWDRLLARADLPKLRDIATHAAEHQDAILLGLTEQNLERRNPDRGPEGFWNVAGEALPSTFRAARGLLSGAWSLGLFAAQQVRNHLEYVALETMPEKEWERRMVAAQDAALELVGALGTQMVNAPRFMTTQILKASGVNTTKLRGVEGVGFFLALDEEDYRRQSRYYREDPVMFLLDASLFWGTMFRAAGAGMTLARANGLSALDRAALGWKAGGQVFNRLITGRSMLDSVVKPVTMKGMETYINWRIGKALDDPKAVAAAAAAGTEAKAALLKQYMNENDDLRRVLEREQVVGAQRQVIDEYLKRADEMAAIAAAQAQVAVAVNSLSKLPWIGYVLKNWLLRPSQAVLKAETVLPLFQAVRGKAEIDAMRVFEGAEQTYQKYRAMGVADDAAVAFVMAAEKTGDVGMLFQEGLELPYAKYGDKILAGGEAAPVAAGAPMAGPLPPRIVIGRPYTLEELTAKAAEAKVPVNELAGRLAFEALEDAAKNYYPPTGGVKPLVHPKWDVAEVPAFEEAIWQDMAQTGSDYGPAALRWWSEALEAKLRAGEVRLPEITGMSKDAMKFGLVMHKLVGKLGFGSGTPIDWAEAYSLITQKSPMFHAPTGTGNLAATVLDDTAKKSIALHLMREYLSPKVQAAKVVPKDWTVKLSPADPGRWGTDLVEIPVAEFMDDAAPIVRSLSTLAYDSALSGLMSGRFSLAQVKAWGGKYWQHKWQRGKGWAEKGLAKFAQTEGQGLDPAVRAEMAAQLVEQGPIPTRGNRWDKENLSPFEKERRERSGLDPAEFQKQISLGSYLWNWVGGVSEERGWFTGEKWRSRAPGKATMAGQWESGAAGRRAFRELSRQSQAEIMDTAKNMMLGRYLDDTLAALPQAGRAATNVVNDLLNSAAVSPATAQWLERRGLQMAQQFDPTVRLKMAVNVLRHAEVLHLSPELPANVRRLIIGMGFKNLDDVVGALPGLKHTPYTIQSKAFAVSPEVSTVLRHYAEHMNPRSGLFREFTKWFKANLLTFRGGPWFRDYVQNRWSVAPMYGLNPWSSAWAVAPRLLEGDNAMSALARIEGYFDASMMAETGINVMGEAVSFRKGLWKLAKDARESSRVYGGNPAGWGKAMLDGAISASKFLFDPRKTKAGKFLAMQRNLTDTIPRMAYTVNEFAREASLRNPQLLGQLGEIATVHGQGLRLPKQLPGLYGQADRLLTAVYDTGEEVRKAAYRRAVNGGAKKAAAEEMASAAQSRYYNESFAKLLAAVPVARQQAITAMARDAFVDASDKSRLMEFLTGTGIMPFLNYSATMIPRRAKWLLTNPVAALAWRGIHRVGTELMWAAMGETTPFYDVEKTQPVWQQAIPAFAALPFKFGTTEFEGEFAGGIDMTWFSELNVGDSLYNPMYSPLVSTATQAYDVVKGAGPARATYPRKYSPSSPLGEPAGELLHDPGALGLQRYAQGIASIVGQLLPDLTPLPFGPGPLGISGSPTVQYFKDALTAPRSAATPATHIGVAAQRLWGVKTVGLGEPFRGAQLKAQTLGSAKRGAQAVATGAKAREGLASRFDAAPRELNAYLGDYVKEAAGWSDLAAKTAPPGKAPNIKTGADEPNKVEFDARVKYMREHQKEIVDKVRSVTEEVQALLLEQFETVPPGQWTVKIADANRMVKALEGEVRDRAVKSLLALRDGRSPSRLEYIVSPMTTVLAMGFTPQVFDALEYEEKDAAVVRDVRQEAARGFEGIIRRVGQGQSPINERTSDTMQDVEGAARASPEMQLYRLRKSLKKRQWREPAIKTGPGE